MRQFVVWSAKYLGIEISFKGFGVSEKGFVTAIIGNKAPGVSVGQEIIEVNEKYFRLTEVDSLLGEANKAKMFLGWEPKITAKEMCEEMTESDYAIAKQTYILKEHGMSSTISVE